MRRDRAVCGVHHRPRPPPGTPGVGDGAQDGVAGSVYSFSSQAKPSSVQRIGKSRAPRKAFITGHGLHREDEGAALARSSSALISPTTALFAPRVPKLDFEHRLHPTCTVSTTSRGGQHGREKRAFPLAVEAVVGMTSSRSTFRKMWYSDPVPR